MKLFNVTVELTDRLTQMADIMMTTVEATDHAHAIELAEREALRCAALECCGDIQPHDFRVFSRVWEG